MLRPIVPLSGCVLLLSACLSAGGGGDGGDASETGGSDTGASETSPTTTDAPTTGGSSSGGEQCEACEGEAACVGGSCVDVGRADLERGCNPLGDPAARGQCLYPWPSDFSTVPDAEAATGLRVAYDPALLPVSDKDQAFAADEVMARLDGFSPHSQIRFSVAAVDPAGLPGIADIGASLAEDSNIVLLEGGTGERWPCFAEVDATAEPGEPVTVFVRPMKRLTPGQRYVVAVRGLRSPDGEPLAATPLFAALRDEQSTDVPQLEALRGSYKGIFSALAAAGVARADLQLAWAFTTASDAALQRDFLAIAPQVDAAAGMGDLGYTIEETEEQPNDKLALILRGTFRVPSCLTGDSGPGAVLARDDAGRPDCSGEADAPFVLAVPQAVWDAGVPAPFVIYGHGLLGTGESAVGIAEQATDVIVAGTDFWGMAEEDIGTVATVLSNNFAGGATLPDRLLQATVNFTALTHLGAGDLQAEPLLQQVIEGEKTSLIDPTRIHYLGGSQGGIMGGTVVAMAPTLRRGVLVVGGANYSLMIWRSTAFSQLGALFAGSQPDPQDREFLFSIFQSSFDRADPLTYKDLIDEPLDGGEAKRLLLVESIGDAQVPNVASELLARTYGMQMVAPAVAPVWGVPAADGPIEAGSAMLQVDTKKGPLPPPENVPLGDDNGAHGSAVDGAAVLGIVVRFIFDGVIDNACDGPCDPE